MTLSENYKLKQHDATKLARLTLLLKHVRSMGSLSFAAAVMGTASTNEIQ